MTPRHPLRLRGVIVIVTLLLCSLFSFQLGQEAHALVSHTPIGHMLDDVTSRQATGALGAAVPSAPTEPPRVKQIPQRSPAPPRSVWSAERHATPSQVISDVGPNPMSQDALGQCPPGDTQQMRMGFYQITPDGSYYAGTSICVSTDQTTEAAWWSQAPRMPGLLMDSPMPIARWHTLSPTWDPVAENGEYGEPVFSYGGRLWGEGGAHGYGMSYGNGASYGHRAFSWCRDGAPRGASAAWAEQYGPGSWSENGFWTSAND
jgi:hypothetical protein